MADISNTMIITDSSLSSVSRELINKRIYKDGLITIVGDPTVVNGQASNISSSNYFTYSNFSFSNLAHSVRIEFNGNYAPSDTSLTSCAFELSGNGTDSLSLLFTFDSITLKYGNNIIKQISNLTLDVENLISTSLVFTNSYTEEEELESQECIFTVILDNDTQVFTIPVYNFIYFNNFNLLTLGNSASTLNPWKGNIDLAGFALSQNNMIIYTPSAKNSFKFTKVMIADSSYPLNDNSYPVLNHVYSFPINEISCTQNNILLTATIPEEAYLNINQLGLYYEDDLGTHLFSSITGLTIKKTRDLVYNLVIHVKLDLNVVNTVAMPEIVVKGEKYIKYSDFLTVKQVYAYITENLERMIKLNALGIGSYAQGAMTDSKPVGVGYNRTQVFYRLQSDLALWEDNFIATTDYARVKKRFSPHTTIHFDPSHINLIGGTYLNESTGELSAFSISSYAYTDIFPLNTRTNWKLNINFSTSSDINSTQSISCFKSDAIGQPLTLGIESGYFTLKIDARDEAIVFDMNTNETYIFYRNGTGTINDETYYVWSTDADISPSSIYTTIYRDLTTTTPVYDAEGNQVSMEFNQQVNSTIINQRVFELQPLKDYEVTIEYTNNIYKVSYKVNSTSYDNVYSLASSKHLNTVTQTLFGIGYTNENNSSPFSGVINLYNTELLTSEYEEGQIKNQIYNFLLSTIYDKSLLDYFHLPVYAHSYFLVNNLGTEQTSYLEEYEGAFHGYYDRIYFDNPKGFTLCTKVHLYDEKDKILLAKGNTDSELFYFILKQENNALTFTLYLDSDTVVLTKEFTPQTIRGFIDYPITITITCDGSMYSPTFKMYKNNELLDTLVLPDNATLNVSNMYLMNHEALTQDEDLEVHTVYDIICFEGELSPTEIYYMNNILDTNF